MCRLIAILSLALLASCGDDSDDGLPRGTDRTLTDPVAWVYSVAKAAGAPRGHKIDHIAWGNPPHGWIGFCHVASVEQTDSWGQTEKYPYREIVVARGYSGIPLYTLVAHEMGHCAYDVPHSDEESELMYPELRYYSSFEDLEAALLRMLSNIGLIPGED